MHSTEIGQRFLQHYQEMDSKFYQEVHCWTLPSP